MSDVLKSIADDLNEFSAFLKEAGIRKEFANVGPYCARARHARKGFFHGYRGHNLLAYIGKEMAVDELMQQVDKLENDFQNAVAAGQKIEDFIRRGTKGDPKNG